MLDHLLTATQRLLIGTALLAYFALWMWALWGEIRKEYQPRPAWDKPIVEIELHKPCLEGQRARLRRFGLLRRLLRFIGSGISNLRFQIRPI